MSRGSRAKKRKQIAPQVEQSAPPVAVQPKRPATVRLVIRARIVPDTPPPPTRRSQARLTPAVIILGAAVLVLIIAGTVGLLSNKPATGSASRAAADSATVVSDQARVDPDSLAQSPSAAASSSAPAAPTHQAVKTPAVSPPTVSVPTVSLPTVSVNEVLPDVPQSALQTIRGTIRVSIQVTLAPDGTVRSAATRVPGPSRYFERLALGAAKKWTFTQASDTDERTRLVIFSFTRDGVTAKSE